jgi:ferredoxin-NADP reductase
MDSEQIQGLLWLYSGVATFFLLLLGLRFFSFGANKSDEDGSSSQEWTQPEELEIVSILSETHDIKTFVLKRSENKVFPIFQAGQFLSFEIDGNAKTIRSYSISSASVISPRIEVSIKHIKDGVGSTWFHQLKEGDRVKAYPPSGHFVDPGPSVEGHRVLVAGGVGITPVLSILRSQLLLGKGPRMSLFYGMRSQKDMAFHALLEYWAGIYDHFDYFPILSHDETWTGDKGFLSFDYISNQLGNLDNHYFFICGPAPMADPLVERLEALGLPEERIVTEQFVSPVTFDPSSLPERQLKVDWMGEVLEYSGRLDLLSFLESKGKALPYACRSGVCGSCKCRVKGPYHMVTDAGLSRSEKGSGLALACVTFPEGDVKVTTD